MVVERALLVMPALTIALTNHKGGCGKTTSTANLGAAFAERGCGRCRRAGAGRRRR